MSKHILENVRLFAGGADYTGQSNKVELGAECEDKDVTNFGSVDAAGKVWKEVLAGNSQAKMAASGQWEAGDTSKVDDDAWAALGGAGAWTVFPHSLNAAVGDVAWFTTFLRAQYQLLGQQGDVAPWQQSGMSTWPLVRGVSAHPPGTARTATGTGTAHQLGATLTGQYLYAALHVLSVSGTDTPTITVKVQSDNGSGFASPTDQITFSAATARGGQIARVAGPITDDYIRAQWTVSGTNPSFLFLLAVGIK
jgi:hypothetical protein